MKVANRADAAQDPATTAVNGAEAGFSREIAHVLPSVQSSKSDEQVAAQLQHDADAVEAGAVVATAAESNAVVATQVAQQQWERATQVRMQISPFLNLGACSLGFDPLL